MKEFIYTPRETALLSQRDKRLGAFIAQKGYIRRTIFEDIFEGLCYNIVNQQLSMKACDTLWAKLCTRLGGISPQNCADAEALKAAGLSRAKAECISRCAQLFISGEITAQQLSAMDDGAARAVLTSIKGIGAWTAEMTLIFCLGRTNVLSLSDYGIRKGLSLLHGLDIKDIKAMEKFRKLYSPYGTVASFYLWEAAREL